MSDEKEVQVPKLTVKVPTSVGGPQESGEVTTKLRTQGEIDREESQLRIEAEKLRIRRELMEIKKLEHDLAKIAQQEALEQVSHEQVEAVLSDTRRETEAIQSACNHMKGGTAEDFRSGAVVMGNNAMNYAMIDHTFSSGVRFRMCQRCGKTWFPKDFDYRWAMSRPSKNSRSIAAGGPSLVRFRDPERAPRMESEIPHRSKPQAEIDVCIDPSQAPDGY